MAQYQITSLWKTRWLTLVTLRPHGGWFSVLIRDVCLLLKFCSQCLSGEQPCCLYTLMSVQPEAVSDVEWRVKSRIQHSENTAGVREVHITGNVVLTIYRCLYLDVFGESRSTPFTHAICVYERENVCVLPLFKQLVAQPFGSECSPCLYLYLSLFLSLTLSLSHIHTDICCVNIASVNRPLAVSSKHREHVSTSPRFGARGHSVYVWLFLCDLESPPHPLRLGFTHTHTHTLILMLAHTRTGWPSP